MYTKAADSFIVTDTQLVVMRAAAEAGCGSQVLASFTNGIIYKYFPGEPLNPAKYDNKDIRR